MKTTSTSPVLVLALLLLAAAALSIPRAEAEPATAPTLTAPAQPGGVKIDCAFPGGNIIVDQIEGDTVRLRQDNRDSKPWFYWYFRATGAAGRTVEFVFEPGVVGVHGPAVSLDKGVTWKWLGADSVKEGRFSYAFPAGADDVRFSDGMPYLQSNLDSFLSRYQGNPVLRVGSLTKTPKGRNVVMIEAGAKKARYAVAITCRHHCSEMMASYTVEGILEGVLADDATGRWLRENVEFLFVPFMDTDGAEDGDQGKERTPHDHNRDYAAEPPLYKEVAALKERLPAWAEGRPLVFIDLHDPALKGDIHETIAFLAPQEPDQAERMNRLGDLFGRDMQGTLRVWFMPFGMAYNNHVETPSPLSCGWARSLPNILLGFTGEVAYANANGYEVNAHSARELGRDVAVALKDFLQETSGATTKQ